MLGYTAELRVHAREVSGSASAMAKGTKVLKVLLSLVGQGVAAALKWKNANKYGTGADEFRLLWKQLGAVGKASDLEPDLDLS
ncbi:unnamed protein product [Rangifer tarandus platyrhynchus]|uniref:Uncharacterized protein n=2 Tax=Rangifer tarandus platyrhynchus TaxID=3082113 RepID=A0ABN8YKA4_RANTA|nr:unnamed protein product [Rangifer tarandus platyrhynchus]CAI9697073.1 unnamed protein product [Rangifer tarandus platyrhynchus]